MALQITAIGRIQFLARELPCAVGAAKKKKKKEVADPFNSVMWRENQEWIPLVFQVANGINVGKLAVTFPNESSERAICILLLWDVYLKCEFRSSRRGAVLNESD